MKDFLTKNGKLNLASLARFINSISRLSLSRRKEKNTKEFECLYLGAFCKLNNISKEDIIKLLNLKEQINEIKEQINDEK